MKFDMEEEVESLPHSKKSMAPQSKSKLSSGQKSELEEAKAVLERIASETGQSVEDLMGNSSQDEQMDEMEDESEGHEEAEESEEDGEMEDSKDKGKKLALYIAQMRSKRG